MKKQSSLRRATPEWEDEEADSMEMCCAEEDSERTEEKLTFSAVPQQTTSKKPTFNEFIGM